MSAPAMVPQTRGWTPVPDEAPAPPIGWLLAPAAPPFGVPPVALRPPEPTVPPELLEPPRPVPPVPAPPRPEPPSVDPPPTATPVPPVACPAVETPVFRTLVPPAPLVTPPVPGLAPNPDPAAVPAVTPVPPFPVCPPLVLLSVPPPEELLPPQATHITASQRTGEDDALCEYVIIAALAISSGELTQAPSRKRPIGIVWRTKRLLRNPRRSRCIGKDPTRNRLQGTAQCGRCTAGSPAMDFFCQVGTKLHGLQDPPQATRIWVTTELPSNAQIDRIRYWGAIAPSEETQNSPTRVQVISCSMDIHCCNSPIRSSISLCFSRFLASL